MKNAYNFELGHLYQMPYTVSVIDELALLLIQQMLFLAAPEKKVIVVDCDDTLWNGIVGEDGVDKIYCDRNSRGIVHLHFQQFLKKKKDEGFLLCICSKNNEQDVEEAFRKKKMPLSSEDFILKKVNWKSKPDNIRELASELSLGLDSFIMIDDSQFEVDYIKEVIPEITVLRFSKRYIDFLNLIDDFAFRRKRYTTEDINKTEQYIIEQKRQEAIRTITSFEDYILQLQLKMDISLNNIGEIERYAQMTEKTNQFNFNKEIFTIKQLEDFIVAGGLLYGMKLTDKFGDYGTVGMMLIETGNDLAIVRNYLMSCRALGRGVEEKFFDRVLGELDHKGLKLGGIKFQVTPKNKPAQEFYHKRFKKDE
ncbi:MAG: HAD-IIIC family phosphatase [Bacteroidetes bacterium]|nr:HAD-IIIC family phosphatase [Bacteroidota bacterium]